MNNEIGDCFIEEFMVLCLNGLRLTKCAIYLIKTYISVKSKFPPIIWDLNVALLALTKNPCNSYHSRFNLELSPTFYYFQFLNVL